MATEVQIPSEQRAELARLLAWPVDKAAALLAALRAEPPSLALGAMARRLATTVGIAAEELAETLLLLAGMYLTSQSSNTMRETFVDAVLASARDMSELEAAQPIDWSRARQLLIDLLSCDRSLGITAKAAGVVYEHERLFSRARVLTDMRPIFGDDVAQSPAAAVIVHTLRLTYVLPQGHKEPSAFYVSLDTNDLQQLRDQIDRALAKNSRSGNRSQRLSCPYWSWRRTRESSATLACTRVQGGSRRGRSVAVAGSGSLFGRAA